MDVTQRGTIDTMPSCESEILRIAQEVSRVIAGFLKVGSPTRNLIYSSGVVEHPWSNEREHPTGPNFVL
jgi:hypothetical protein